MSTPPGMMGATLGFNDALNEVRNLVNASSTVYDGAGATMTDPVNDDTERWPEGVLIDAIRGADALIYSKVASLPGHPKRAALLAASANILHGGLIPAHEGPLDAVLIGSKAPQVLPAREIQVLRDAGVFIFADQGPYYDIVGNVLFYYPGATAVIYIVPPYASTGSALMSPQSYFNGVVALALAMLFGKEGAETPTANHYLSYGQMVMADVEKGAAFIQPVVAYQGGMSSGN